MVTRYFEKCGVDPGTVEQALQKHLKLYLGWRYLVNERKDGFIHLDSVRWAQSTDTEGRIGYYLEGQHILAAQIKAKGIGGAYHSKAQEIFKEIKSAEFSWFMHNFFDGYVHDSYAGFIGQFKGGFAGATTHIMAEPRRYLCYRLMFSGDDARLNVMTDQQHRIA